MRKVVLKTRVKVLGRIVPEGAAKVSDEELKVLEAEELLVTEGPKPKPENDPPVEHDHEAIAAVIRDLTAADFDKDGNPKVGAINTAQATGAPKVTREVRDEVWAGLVASGFTAPIAAA